jgi:murein L,D-transpeptidase YcbB/YkuD
MIRSSGTRVIARVTIAAVMVPVLLTGCADDTDPPSSAAGATTTASEPVTASPRPTTTAAPSRAATSAAPSPSPTSNASADDENGELAGQLIIEYPGKPLKRTTSTAKNADVVDLQVRLNEVGFPVAADGIFGASTEQAVKRFQRDTGLVADGIVGPATWAALFTFEG